MNLGAQHCPGRTLAANYSQWDIDTLEGLADTTVVLPTRDGLSVRLRRFRAAGARRVVLLVHGASAGSRTFMVPRGGLLRYLVQKGFDVWTLDWRASNQFREFDSSLDSSVRLPPLRGLDVHWSEFNLDAAAEHDLAATLDDIGHWLGAEGEGEGGPKPTIAVLGHCVGGALVMQALATGLLTRPAASYRLGAVVLSTLALFYRVGLEGWLKGNEFVLEELTTTLDAFDDPARPVINPVLGPAEQWPSPLEHAFQSWRTTLFAPNGWGRTTPGGAADTSFLERIAFMYGMPFHTGRISKEVGRPEALRRQFGDMPLAIYMHCVRNLRLGYPAPFSPAATREHYVSPQFLVRAGKPAVPLTLITGAQNQVWHRDSIDRTHEWLLNQIKPSARSLLVKEVLTDYGHQDLLWSDQSHEDVYPKVETGLLLTPEPD